MEKYISKEHLGDFITKMWEAGIERIELRPEQKTVELWNKDFNKHITVNVGIMSYDDVVKESLSKFQEA